MLEIKIDDQNFLCFKNGIIRKIIPPFIKNKGAVFISYKDINAAVIGGKNFSQDKEFNTYVSQYKKAAKLYRKLISLR